MVYIIFNMYVDHKRAHRGRSRAGTWHADSLAGPPARAGTRLHTSHSLELGVDGCSYTR